MTKKELELENAKLRGQVAALEKVLEAYKRPTLSPADVSHLSANSGGHGSHCRCYSCERPWGY